MTPLVFITGASSGIGQALALRYQQAGYRLALVGRRTEPMHAWAKTKQVDPSSLQIYEADVSEVDSITGAAQLCLDVQGLPDIVIASAGFSTGFDTAERGDLDMMARMFATNNVGLAATFHPFVRAMAQRGSGRLVGIASVNGIRGMPGHGAYCASKAGVISYCESLRGELSTSGVKVVTISPGYIRTPLTQGNAYSMPFLMEAADFADHAYRAIEKGTSYCVIPWQMGVVAKFLRVLPNSMFDKFFAGRPRKARQS